MKLGTVGMLAATIMIPLASGGATASGLAAQEFEGRVVAAGNGAPLSGALVELIGSRLVTLTDADGAFSFRRIGLEFDSLRISRLGWETRTAWVEIDALDAPTFRLRRAPIILEGITADMTMETRLAWIEERLDQRVGEWPGVARVADREDLRPFDEDWEGNHWEFLHNGPLGVKWNGDMPASRPAVRQARTIGGFESGIWGPEVGYGIQSSPRDLTWVDGYGVITLEWWLDDQRTLRDAVLRTPNESLCRVEIYIPERYVEDIQPAPQLRAYTCSFLGRVAIGADEICPVLQQAGLFIGPSAQAGITPIIRFTAARPRGAIDPIRLEGAGEYSDGSPGIDSRACR
jgi:hypothetical protein